MMPNVTRGRGMAGLMSYLVSTDPERTSNVHENPHLVAGDPAVMSWWSDAELGHDDALSIARDLDQPRKAFQVDVPGGHVWHGSWSLAAVEGQLSDERWGLIASDIADGMGFSGADGKAPCRWVAVRHGLSKAGNDHIHMVVNLVRTDGTKVNIWRDYKRAQDLARRLEVKHGLVVLEGRAVGRGSRAPSAAELAKAAREGKAEPDRISLARSVRGHAAAATSEADFVRRMRAGGLWVSARFAAGAPDVVTGYAVAVRPAAGSQAVWFGGSTLGKDLSLPRLRTGLGGGWEDTPAAASEAVGEWQRAKGARPMVRPPQGPVVDPKAWQEFAPKAGAVREWLRTVPVEDTATWAQVCGQMSGVLSAWSAAVEKGRPGPLARAADVFAGQAQLPGWQVADPLPGPTLYGIARVAASAAVGGRGLAGQALMVRQLLNLAKAVHDMNVARAQLVSAGRVESVARGELAQLAASLPALEVPAPLPVAVREPARVTSRAAARRPVPAPSPARQQQEVGR